MKEKYMKRTGPHDIREAELNIILSIDDKSAEDHEFGASRKKYFEIKSELDEYTEELHRKLSMLDGESGRLKVLNGKQAVYEEGIKDLRNEILILRKQYSVVENPELVLEEFKSQEIRIPELAEKKRTLEREIYELERQSQDNIDDIEILNTRQKKISSDIAEEKLQKETLSQEYKDIEKSAKILIDRDELETKLSELEASVADRTEEMKSVNNILADCNQLVPDLNKTVKSLQGKLGSLKKRAKDLEHLMNERESLTADVSDLENDNNSINLKVEELLREAETKEGTLQELSLANAEMKDAIESIERYIADSSHKVKEINREKKRLRDSDRLNEDAIAKMDGLFNKIKMDNHLSRTGEEITAVIRIIEAAKEI